MRTHGAALGAGVYGYKVGDEVYGVTGAFYAEYATIRAKNVAHVPWGINRPRACHSWILRLVGVQGIDDMLNLRSGES